MAENSVPSGWFPDPSDPRQFRYWDGVSWTLHTHPMQVPIPAEGQSRPVELLERVDEHGDRILFQERTHGTVKRQLTVTSQRLTFDKRSIAFADVEQMLTDVTQMMTYGIKSATSYTINLVGGPGKPVGVTTQSLPLRAERHEAPRQFEEVTQLLEVHLVPQLLDRLHHAVIAGGRVTIGRAVVRSDGISFGKGRTLPWGEYCSTTTKDREIRVTGPTPDVVHGKIFFGNANSQLLGRLCDRFADSFT
jgi:Protein of unknown function (DUF2510)